MDGIAVHYGQNTDNRQEDVTQRRIKDIHRIGEVVFELSLDEGAVHALLLVLAFVACDGFAFVVRHENLVEGDGKDPVNKSEQSDADNEEDDAFKRTAQTGFAKRVRRHEPTKSLRDGFWIFEKGHDSTFKLGDENHVADESGKEENDDDKGFVSAHVGGGFGNEPSKDGSHEKDDE